MPRPPLDLRAEAGRPGTVILDPRQLAHGERRAWLFRSPERILAARRPDEVRGVLREAEALAREGRSLVGVISYEAAEALGLAVHPPAVELPLVWLGVYRKGIAIRKEDWPDPPEGLGPWKEAVARGVFNVTGAEYQEAVERAREWMAAGDSYQVNLTCKFRFVLPDETDPFSYYCHLSRAHPVPFGAFLNLGETQILSLSPELFLRRRGRRLTTRPMKGTMHRGLGVDKDERLRRELKRSVKNRAENVMIVDLMRNDLGRVCEIGSIRVPRLFECERYETVHQMTSTVEGTVREGVGLVEILEAAFPCGSVTGAPKYRTMQIIRDLEKEPRGPYCGAIGRIGPGPNFEFNVAIRTLVHRAGRCELGVGSGITWASDAEAEWKETRLKTRFLYAPVREFRLFETLLLRSDGRYAYLPEHARRLGRSARYWGFRFPRKRVLEALEEAARRDVPNEGVIVRISLDPRGNVDVTTRPLDPLPTPARVLLREDRARGRDPLVYHKTDARAQYDRGIREARAQGCVDALFCNRRGRLTEGGFTNLFVELD
ncbi:MAG TPA: aminodeoxychorismate synthase component I, partial [Sumerlaeia bacterium]|nr:aminodeoxychorismate synthase component I [Sumerlaeia bacterium]